MESAEKKILALKKYFNNYLVTWLLSLLCTLQGMGGIITQAGS